MSIEIGLLIINTVVVVAALLVSYLAYFAMKKTDTILNEQKNLLNDMGYLLFDTRDITVATQKITDDLKEISHNALEIQRKEAMINLFYMSREAKDPNGLIAKGMKLYANLTDDEEKILKEWLRKTS